MAPRILLHLVFIVIQVFAVSAWTNPDDAAALKALKAKLQNLPPNWEGSDPCESRWEGISCINSRVVSITLSSLGLSGVLSVDIQGLKELQTVDLSYNRDLKGSLPYNIGDLKELTSLILVGCSFSGQIPESIGSLEKLVFLSLNSNNFIGPIPASLGKLSNLHWLDIADNKLEGSIPVSNGTSPGLDMLLEARHFHFGRNRLSGEIPAQLFNSNMTLIHLLLDSNHLEGSIPDTLGLVQTLVVVRLDNNSLSGPVPTSLNNLIHVTELYLSNNQLTGALPNLTGMSSLNLVDMSNNSFVPTDVPPWFSTLDFLITVIMESTQIRGELPVGFFGHPQLKTVILRNNQLNGTLNIGSSHSGLQLIDLQHNLIDSFTERAGYKGVEIILVDNPFCLEGRNDKYCTPPGPSNDSYSSSPQDCSPPQCSSDQVSSPTCQCAYPYSGNIYFRAISVHDFENTSNYELLRSSMMLAFALHKLPVDSVSVSDPMRNLDGYPALHLQIFPSGQDHFNRTGVIEIGFELSNQTYKPPHLFQPFHFLADNYEYFDGISSRSSKSSSTRIIIGAAVGGSVLMILLVLAGVYALRQKQRAEIASRRSDPFASWDPEINSGDIPQLKGAKHFSLDALKKYSNNFSETNVIGVGGYGKVYRGTLPNGKLVAIKRAQQGSKQGSLEFKTEIELLSRVHHKNLVNLVGFCFDQGEQLLVYEYIPNGTLRDSLLGRSGFRLDWTRRLRIALGAAKGVQYLHDLANPPIIHRDIKSSNILLDENLIAKVSDFGLCKIAAEPEKGHVSTQVKGTMGYLDPEYYMTQQLTEKSDVYSFGVVLLELIVARNPIEKGMYIVREVKKTMDRTKEAYNLQRLLDPFLGANWPPRSIEQYVDLAMKCVVEEGNQRPAMSEVVKEVEGIMEAAGLNPNVDSASTSASYEGAGKEHKHPYSNESIFSNSGGISPSKFDSK